MHQYSTIIMCFLLENKDTKYMYWIKAYFLVAGFIYTFGYYWRL